jgi:hypothetical protein
MNQTLGTVFRGMVPIEGDPKDDPKYIENAVRGVGIAFWGGPFTLDRRVVNGQGVDSVMLPRDQVNLDSDPLSENQAKLNLVFKSREAADTALAGFPYPGAFTYYVGPGRYIYPTIISDTTAPRLCAAFRARAELERTDAKAAEKTSIDLLLWYVGARFPLKPGSAPSAAAPALRAGGEKGALVFVEVGAGDLKASIELAKKGGVKVIAVDPVAASPTAVKELQAAGGQFIKGTTERIAAGTADHVFQYFPWRITGAGKMVTGGTWRLIQDTVRLLKPGGAAHFVTEDFETAEFLAKEASSHGFRVAMVDSTAAAAAPGATGAAVPGFARGLKVWLVNIYQ